MRRSLYQIKGVFDKTTFIKPLNDGREAIPYLAVSNTTVSLALIREEWNVQKPVYYTSQAFQGAEVSYPRMEKIAFALLVPFRKLHSYFQAHPIVVMTNQSIRKMMNKIDAAGRLIQWPIELGQFDIEYQPRVAIKIPSIGKLHCRIHLPL